MAFVALTGMEPGRDPGTVLVAKAADAAPVAGSPEYFTGAVTVGSRFQRDAPATIGGAVVVFEPGARTNWHTHPLGQTLYVTEGAGWVQYWGGAPQRIFPGDVVWIPPGVKHWHGATSDSGLTHFAVSEAKGGASVEWLEPVTDAQHPD